MGKRKTYTEAFKKDAVRLLLARGTQTIEEVAQRIGVSSSMLHRWHQKYGAELSGSAVRSQDEREDVERMRRRLRELEQENSLLKKAAVGSSGQGREVAVYELIHAERASFPIAFSCRVFDVSRSGYYRWLDAEPSERAQEDAELTVEITHIHRKHKGRYGSPRVHRDLREQGRPVSRKRVARLMRQQGLRGHTPRRFRRTTDSRHSHRIAPNLLARDFAASAPNEAWVGDITYVPTRDGWLYLAVLLDLFSRRVVGWAMSDRIDTELGLSALQMAVEQRNPQPGLIHHTDRDCRYASDDYQAALAQHGMVVTPSQRACSPHSKRSCSATSRSRAARRRGLKSRPTSTTTTTPTDAILILTTQPRSPTS